MATDYDIIVLGAGLGGIGMASRLKAAGLERFVVIEQSDRPGGTWRDNVYPGAACDTESHLYCYSFAPHSEVSRLYARQPELLAYAERLIRDAKLEPHIRYGNGIVSADWDDVAKHWQIGLGSGETLTARIFIPAWGQLNRPSLPDIVGRDTFAGLAFHSARWPTELNLSNKRVASIGNAASAVQYIPEIAADAEWLTVFQRSPNWIVPRGDKPYSAHELERYREDPALFEAERETLFAWRESTFLRMRDGSEEALDVERQARDLLEAQVLDPLLRAMLTPDFPLGCKRVLRSDDYLPALMRDNVRLVTDPIARIIPEGIVGMDGTVHFLDVIVYGTGFETQSFQGPVDVRGQLAASLRDRWSDGARAYLGMTVPDFPNLFLIYGPNTNLGHNSVLSMIEAQFGYIVQAALWILGAAQRTANVRPNVAAAFDARLQDEMTGSAWSAGCRSWYKNDAGRVVNNWSGPVAAYQDQVRRFEPDDYR